MGKWGEELTLKGIRFIPHVVIKEEEGKKKEKIVDTILLSHDGGRVPFMVEKVRELMIDKYYGRPYSLWLGDV